MPSQHAKLGPSASERWIQCPASIRMEAQVGKEQESSYAHEGTVAHELAELKASYSFGLIDKAQFTRRRAAWRKDNADVLDQDEVEVEMERHTDAYVNLIREHMELFPHTQILLEKRVQTGIPQCWGTGDCILVSPEHVEIIDLKYGAGVFVDATKNSQMMLYGVGALEEYGDLLGNPKVVRMTVFQPRMDNVSTYEMKPKKLKKWRDSIIPVAEEALGPDAHFAPSEEACRWCPAAGICRARVEHNTAIDFAKDPDTLDDEELAELLGRIPEIRDWCNAVENYGLDYAYSRDGHIPGYKVVMSGGRRRIVNPEMAIQHLIKNEGFSIDEVAQMKIRGLGELEKLMGKEEMADKLAKFIAKSEGSPSLVVESDKREAIHPNSEAAVDFTKEDLL